MSNEKMKIRDRKTRRMDNPSGNIHNYQGATLNFTEVKTHLCPSGNFNLIFFSNVKPENRKKENLNRGDKKRSIPITLERGKSVKESRIKTTE